MKICSVIFFGTEVRVTKWLEVGVCSFFLPFLRMAMMVAFSSHQKDPPIATIFQRYKKQPQNSANLFPACS